MPSATFSHVPPLKANSCRFLLSDCVTHGPAGGPQFPGDTEQCLLEDELTGKHAELLFVNALLSLLSQGPSRHFQWATEAQA